MTIKELQGFGKNWGKVYGGYFSGKKALNAFVKDIRKILKKLPANCKVLYVCSGTGLLGEYICNYLRAIGKNPSLTIVDVSQEQLKENRNSNTRKINRDVRYLQLGEKFDLIIMRSSLHYFPSAELQVRILKQIVKHLKSRGFFVNQCVVFSSMKERNLANHCRPLKMGKRRFLCTADVPILYTKAGLAIKLIGHAPPILITSRHHVERYGLLRSEVSEIIQAISKVPAALRPNIKITRTGYLFCEEFPIYVAQLWRRNKAIFP